MVITVDLGLKKLLQRWNVINVVYFLFSPQAELYGGLSKPSVAAAPLERRKEIHNIYLFPPLILNSAVMP